MRLIDADAIDFSPLKNDFDRARAKVIIMECPTVDIKTEVAKEIFAEIEKIIELCNIKDYSREGELVTNAYYGTTMVDKLIELKNKYTKEGVGE